MTPHLDAVGLLPEILVASTIGIVLLVDLFIGQRHKAWLQALSFVGVGAALVSVVWLGVNGQVSVMAAGSYVVDDFALLAKGLFLSSALIVLLLGSPSTWKGEYFTLLLASLLGMVMIPSARELIVFFVAFELLAVPGYLLAGWNKQSAHGHESALKYYLLGVVATAVMLYGISLLYGLAGGTTFADLSTFFTKSGTDVALARLALFFFLAGMVFKVSAVPFHFWAPDVYQGAPLPVTVFLSVVSKAAGVVALLNLVAVGLQAGHGVWAPVLWCIALLTMVVGNIAALRQTDIVRLLAYSSIAQAGYLLVPLAVAGPGHLAMTDAITSTFMYLLVYAATNLGAFSVVVAVKQRTQQTALTSYAGLFATAPALAVALTVHVLSLAGVPPFGGWFAKLVIFRAAIDAGGWMSVVVVVVGALSTAIGLVYYAVVVRQLWLAPGPVSSDVHTSSSTSAPVAVALVATTLIVVLSGVLPGIVTTLGGFSSLAG